MSFYTTMLIFWFVLFIVLLVIEIETLNLVTIWFSIGALGAFVASVFGSTFLVQVLLFTIVSIASLYLTRPMAKKMKFKKQATNIDSVPGSECIVSEKVDNFNSTGLVKYEGKIWRARSVDDSVIAENEIAKIIKVEGVTLYIIKKEA